MNINHETFPPIKPTLNGTIESLATCDEDQEIVVFVFTKASAIEERKAIRNTWANPRLYWLTKAKTFFIVPLEPDTVLEGMIFRYLENQDFMSNLFSFQLQ